MARSARRVLVADDDAVILRLLEVNFSLEGYDVTTADRGEKALERSKDGAYDLIVLDVMMPGMDGWEVCKKLKSAPETAHIPVVFLSARTQDEDRERGLRLGVAAYVTKPFDPEELLGLADRLTADA